MPRLQVYLPDDLYEQLKARGLPASELLQEAVRAAIKRQDLDAEMDRYLDDLVDEVGEPTPDELAYAQALVDRLVSRASRQAG